MGLWDLITSQFIDIVEWVEHDSDVMVHRFEHYDNDIKHGAMLTVRESQIAVFVNEGQIADVFPPGLYQLETANLPILSDLQSWPYGFESPFKAEVYFLSTKLFTDLKWGTKKPLMLRDPEYGPLRLRAFGTYSIRIEDPAVFLKEVAGTDGHFVTDEITSQLRNIITSRFADIISSSNIPVLDMAANYQRLGEFLAGHINPEFANYGLSITQLLVENISLPDEVEAALDKRTSAGIVENLDMFTQYQTAKAIGDSGKSDGISAGLGLGIGMAAASKIGKSLDAAPVSKKAAIPPLPMEYVSYFLVVDNKRAGPYDTHELHDQAANGVLTKSSLVWREGMRKWRPARELSELNPIWRSLPPPLPKTAANKALPKIRQRSR